VGPSDFNMAIESAYQEDDKALLWWRHPDNTTCVSNYLVQALDASNNDKPLASWTVQPGSPVEPQTSLSFAPVPGRYRYTVTPQNGRGVAVGKAAQSPVFKIVPVVSEFTSAKFGACQDAPTPAARAYVEVEVLSPRLSAPGSKSRIVMSLPHPDPRLSSCVTGYAVSAAAVLMNREGRGEEGRRVEPLLTFDPLLSHALATFHNNRLKSRMRAVGLWLTSSPRLQTTQWRELQITSIHCERGRKCKGATLEQ